jgi:hypothetical protein
MIQLAKRTCNESELMCAGMPVMQAAWPVGGVTEITYVGTTYSSWVDSLSGLTHRYPRPPRTYCNPPRVHSPQSIPYWNEKKEKKYVAIYFLLERTIQHARTSHVIAGLQSPLTPLSFLFYLLLSPLLVLVLCPRLRWVSRTLGCHTSLSVVTSTGPEAIGTIHRRFHNHLLPRQPDAGPWCSLYVSLASPFALSRFTLPQRKPTPRIQRIHTLLRSQGRRSHTSVPALQDSLPRYQR